MTTKITPVQLNKIRNEDPYDFPGGIDLEEDSDYISNTDIKGYNDFHVSDEDTATAPVDRNEDMTNKQAEQTAQDPLQPITSTVSTVRR